MIITVGICVDCYTQYAIEMHDRGSSMIDFMMNTMQEAEAHLAYAYAAGTPHRITPTILYQEDQ